MGREVLRRDRLMEPQVLVRPVGGGGPPDDEAFEARAGARQDGGPHDEFAAVERDDRHMAFAPSPGLAADVDRLLDRGPDDERRDIGPLGITILEVDGGENAQDLPRPGLPAFRDVEAKCRPVSSRVEGRKSGQSFLRPSEGRDDTGRAECAQKTFLATQTRNAFRHLVERAGRAEKLEQFTGQFLMFTEADDRASAHQDEGIFEIGLPDALGDDVGGAHDDSASGPTAPSATWDVRTSRTRRG